MVVSSKPKEEDVSRFVRWRRTAEGQWNGFLEFLYNKEEKSVLGRNAASWGRITIFYLCYYSFLAALFAISITIVLSTLDPNVPRFQTRVQGPGVSIQPRELSKTALNSDIKYSLSDSNSYEKYVTQMNKFLKAYRDQSDDSKFRDCDDAGVNRTVLNDENKEKIYQRSCRFDISELGVCQNETTKYGYSQGTPCILVKVNRIVNWFPARYFDVTSVGVSEVSDAPALLDVVRTRENGRYNPLRMYVACYGEKEEDQHNLNGEAGVSRNTTYFPQSGGIPFKYYPYLGKRRNPNYLSPLVAVQFNNVQRGKEIKVRCKAYARNIVDDDRMQIGFYSFLIKIDT